MTLVNDGPRLEHLVIGADDYGAGSRTGEAALFDVMDA